MAQEVQTKSNHARVDPPFHFFLIPLLLILFGWSAVRAVRFPDSTSISLAILTFLVLLGVLKARMYAARVQDRVIRLEERLRLATLTSPTTAAVTTESLTESQWVALRFASDAEMPALAERAAREKLTNKQIKDAIQVWRPDYFRI